MSVQKGKVQEQTVQCDRFPEKLRRPLPLVRVHGNRVQVLPEKVAAEVYPNAFSGLRQINNLVRFMSVVLSEKRYGATQMLVQVPLM